MNIFFKKLFCKHDYKVYYKTLGNQFLHEDIWYYDDYQIKKCIKCGKEKEL